MMILTTAARFIQVLTVLRLYFTQTRTLIFLFFHVIKKSRNAIHDPRVFATVSISDLTSILQYFKWLHLIHNSFAWTSFQCWTNSARSVLGISACRSWMSSPSFFFWCSHSSSGHNQEMSTSENILLTVWKCLEIVCQIILKVLYFYTVNNLQVLRKRHGQHHHARQKTKTRIWRSQPESWNWSGSCSNRICKSLNLIFCFRNRHLNEWLCITILQFFL